MPTAPTSPASSPRVALLVGAKRVGGVVAARLADAGYSLAVAYRSSRDEAERIAEELAPVRTLLLQADLTIEDDVRRVVSETVDGLGGLHAVVNLASDFPRAPFDALDSAAWDRAAGIVKGSFLLGVHAARAMARNPGPVRGHVVYFGDWAAEETPYVNYLPYLTAKAGVHFLTRGLAAEVAELGVRVNCIAPGPTMRPPDISQSSWDAAIQAKAPLKQESSAEDIAEVVATLLSTSSITGELIRVDSGRHIRGV